MLSYCIPTKIGFHQQQTTDDQQIIDTPSHHSSTENCKLQLSGRIVEITGNNGLIRYQMTMRYFCSKTLAVNRQNILDTTVV